MTKKIFALVIMTFVAAVIFAETNFETMPKNTITIDFGPTIIGAIMGSVDDGVSSSGFGIAAQYERQVLEQVSAAGRFAYLGWGMIIQGEGFESETGFYSFSLEGHVRYYPLGEVFFVDGMLGYANLLAAFSAKAVGDEPTSVSFNVSRSYLKLGTKLGWRISFGKRGGFTFEPALGYYAGIGLGDTLGIRFAKLAKDGGRDIENFNAAEFDEIFKILENFIFIGGPRVTLSFGWRF